MSKTLLAGMLVLGLVACSPASAKDEAASTARAVSNRPAQRTLVSGTSIEARIQDSLSSRHNKAGETLRATVSSDVKDGYGRVAIPAGSPVALRVTQLQAATNKSQADGKIALEVTSLTVRGQTYQVSSTVNSVPHQLVGRGVTAGEVEKGAGGAVIGAVAGRVIGGDTKGAVIGGAVGAAAGTAAAVHWASRDVVVTPGTPIVFSLPQALTVTAR
jgi:glycine zipper 2TM protein